jgi:RNA polymerase sigma-70 factor (ECF subfamily)
MSKARGGVERGERDPLVAAACAGDEAAFGRLFERHRAELQVHCYRMLGSFVESEDLVQETFLRAWRKRESFEGRSTFRAWLYRIATNACLDALAKRPRRVLPPDVVPAADPEGPPPAMTAHAWLEPVPDRLLERVVSPDDDPDVVVVAKETIELAFLAAIQYLPPKQRAALILRDVLGWSARETAVMLELSVPAVKSALQRARGTLQDRLPSRRLDWAVGSERSHEEHAVLRRYMDALEAEGTEAMAAVLAEDVRVSYPPMALWADGRDDFIAGSSKHAPPGEIRCLATSANMQPATALYLRAPRDTEFRLITLEVLRIDDGKVADIVDFSSPELLVALGLPPTLPTA